MFHKIILSSIIAIVLLSSCSTTLPQSYFIPHEGNTLRLQEKKELKVSSGLMVNNHSHVIVNPVTFLSQTIKSKQASTSFQLAYSPIKHLGVFGMHSRIRLKAPENATINFHKSQLTAGGVGTYFSYRAKQRPASKIKLNSTQKYNNFIIDLYGGYAFGSLENHYNNPTGNTKMDFRKYYLQGGIHWEAGRWTSALVYKIGNAYFNNGIISGQPNNLNDAPIQAVLNHDRLFFNEFTFKLDYNIKDVLLYGQATIGVINEFEDQGIITPLLHGGLIINIHNFIKNTN